MKKTFILLFPSVVVLILCGVWFYNSKCQEGFWNVNFYEIISTILTCIIALIGFYVSISIIEYNNDNRRFTDSIVNILHKMDNLLEDSSMIPTQEDLKNNKSYLTTKRKILSLKKSFSNYLSLLNNELKKDFIKAELDNINKHFNNYDLLIDAIFESRTIGEETLSKLEHNIEIMKTNVCKIELKLYKPK